jgi:hypothetical protein
MENKITVNIVSPNIPGRQGVNLGNNVTNYLWVLNIGLRTDVRRMIRDSTM